MFALGDYRVKFQHKTDSNNKPISTICRIEIPETVTGNVTSIKAVGIAFCHPVDQYDRNTGRKLALSRALHSFPREERAAFWIAYYQKRGNRW